MLTAYNFENMSYFVVQDLYLPGLVQYAELKFQKEAGTIKFGIADIHKYYKRSVNLTHQLGRFQAARYQ